MAAALIELLFPPKIVAFMYAHSWLILTASDGLAASDDLRAVFIDFIVLKCGLPVFALALFTRSHTSSVVLRYDVRLHNLTEKMTIS